MPEIIGTLLATDARYIPQFSGTLFASIYNYHTGIDLAYTTDDPNTKSGMKLAYINVA